MAQKNAVVFHTGASVQSSLQENRGDPPQHHWKAFSSIDRHLVDTVARMAAQYPEIKKHADALHQRGNVEVRLVEIENNNFKTSLDKLLDESPHTVKYSVIHAGGNSGIYAREVQRAIETTQPSAAGKKIVTVTCSPDASGALSKESFEGLASHVARFAETGKWPPIFAVLKRPASSVTADEMDRLCEISVEKLRSFHGKYLFDLRRCGFMHIEGAGRRVAPIITLKVAHGDTEGTHWALEREAKPGDVLLIDGGYFVQDGQTPTYAYVGDMMREIAISHGVKGFIVDGFIRDRAVYDSKDGTFLCFSRHGVTPNGPSKVEAGAVHLPIQGDGYAAESNDICIADGDNLFIVPSGNVDVVIRAASSSSGSIAPRQDTIFPAPTRQSTLTYSEHSATDAGASAEGERNASPSSKELLQMLKDTPTAEISDAFSTQDPPHTAGIALHPPTNAKSRKSAGTALIAGGSEEALRHAVKKAGANTTLVVPADDPKDVTINSAVLKQVRKKHVQAVVTGGTAALSVRPSIPVYAAGFVDSDVTVQAGQDILQTPVRIQGVQIKPGETVVGDADGVAVVPQGQEEFALRGGHAIMAKESKALPRIRAGTAPKRELAYPLYPSNDHVNAPFLRAYIDCRDAPVLTARGSSGLKIPKPRGVRSIPATSVQAGNSVRESLMQAFKSGQGRTLQAGEVEKGKPKEVISNDGGPMIVQIERRSMNPFKPAQRIYVSGVAGDNFRELMRAKEKGKSVVINDQGGVQRGGLSMKKLRSRIARVDSGSASRAPPENDSQE